jgi:hypothetical protein
MAEEIPAGCVAAMREKGVHTSLCSGRIEQKLRLAVLMLYRVVVPNRYGTIWIPVTGAAIAEKSIVACIDENQPTHYQCKGNLQKPLQSML